MRQMLQSFVRPIPLPRRIEQREISRTTLLQKIFPQPLRQRLRMHTTTKPCEHDRLPILDQGQRFPR